MGDPSSESARSRSEDVPRLRAASLRVSLGRRPVLHNIALQVFPGEVFAVLGPNGAGKTTLLKTLAGLLPYEGQVSLEGRPLSHYDRDERARQLAFVPQRTELTSALSVRSVVAQGRYPHRHDSERHDSERRDSGRPSRSNRDAIDQAMRVADVDHLEHRSFPELSHGERRRVLVARALATEARTLLLDEPTASLDIGHALDLYELVRALAKDNFSIVMVLHQLNDALRFSDRALLLQDGQEIVSGTTAEVVSPHAIEQAYQVSMKSGGAMSFHRSGRHRMNGS